MELQRQPMGHHQDIPVVQDHVTSNRARDPLNWFAVISIQEPQRLTPTAFDEANLKLYLSLSQIFSVWLIPLHVCPVTLTTVLDLTTEAGDASSLVNGDHRFYYIAKQEDLYQTSEFVKFVIPHFGHFLVVVLHAFGTLFCVLGAIICSPVAWLEEKGYIPGRAVKGGNLAYNMEKKLPEIRAI